MTKIPRFAFEKFKGAEAVLGTAMKSVGEVMAIGRSIHESLQKALRGLETGLTGFDEVASLARRERRGDRGGAVDPRPRPAADRGAGAAAAGSRSSGSMRSRIMNRGF